MKRINHGAQRHFGCIIQLKKNISCAKCTSKLYRLEWSWRYKNVIPKNIFFFILDLMENVCCIFANCISASQRLFSAIELEWALSDVIVVHFLPLQKLVNCFESSYTTTSLENNSHVHALVIQWNKLRLNEENRKKTDAINKTWNMFDILIPHFISDVESTLVYTKCCQLCQKINAALKCWNNTMIQWLVKYCNWKYFKLKCQPLLAGGNVCYFMQLNIILDFKLLNIVLHTNTWNCVIKCIQ